MNTNNNGAIEAEALRTVKFVFAQLDDSREQKELYSRFLKVTGNLMLNAKPALKLTTEMKCVNDMDFLVKVLKEVMGEHHAHETIK